MSSWRQQVLVEAPAEAVWEYLGDPRRYPEWAGHVVDVTGLPVIERNAEYKQTTKGPIGNVTTTFRLDRLQELREIRMRCQASGWYSHWLLTPAAGGTFVDAEIGIEPTAMQWRIYGALGKRYFRRCVEEALDGLRQALERRPAVADGAGSGLSGPPPVVS
jgi:uncharacterized protein YndB with AHSA1/START domain